MSYAAALDDALNTGQPIDVFVMDHRSYYGMVEEVVTKNIWSTPPGDRTYAGVPIKLVSTSDPEEIRVATHGFQRPYGIFHAFAGIL